MLRITTHVAADSITFLLEGRLAGPWAAEARACWQKVRTETGKPVGRVCLRGVTFVDAAGRALLADMQRQGTALIAADCEMKAIVAEIEHGD